MMSNRDSGPLERLADQTLARERTADRSVSSPLPWAIVLATVGGTLGSVFAGLKVLQVQLIAGTGVDQEAVIVATLLGGGAGVMVGVFLAAVWWMWRVAR